MATWQPSLWGINQTHDLRQCTELGIFGCFRILGEPWVKDAVSWFPDRWDRWDRWYHHPSGRKNTTYIYATYSPCQLGDEKCYLPPMKRTRKSPLIGFFKTWGLNDQKNEKLHIGPGFIGKIQPLPLWFGLVHPKKPGPTEAAKKNHLQHHTGSTDS